MHICGGFSDTHNLRAWEVSQMLLNVLSILIFIILWGVLAQMHKPTFSRLQFCHLRKELASGFKSDYYFFFFEGKILYFVSVANGAESMGNTHFT